MNERTNDEGNERSNEQMKERTVVYELCVHNYVMSMSINYNVWLTVMPLSSDITDVSITGNSLEQVIATLPYITSSSTETKV